jgi:hypothetical protein
MEDDGVECRIGEGVEREGMCVVTIIRILERGLLQIRRRQEDHGVRG